MKYIAVLASFGVVMVLENQIRSLYGDVWGYVCLFTSFILTVAYLVQGERGEARE